MEQASKKNSSTLAVIFDLDGTLVDSRHAVVDAVALGVEQVYQRHGILNTKANHEAILASMGLPAQQYYESILPEEHCHFAPEVKEAATVEEVRALRENEGRLFEGVLEGLQTLRERGIRIAVISNAQKPYFRAALKYLGVEEYLDHSECYEEMPPVGGSTKKALLERALMKLNIEGAHAIMIGDRGEDLEAGRAYGCKTIGLLYGFGTEAELAMGDFVLDNFRSILDCLD